MEDTHMKLDISMMRTKNMLLPLLRHHSHGSTIWVLRISFSDLQYLRCYSFYKDAKLLRLTRYRYNNVPFDSNGHYYYIKEGDTIWNPGWMPAKTDLDAYECHHGMGYSTFRSSKNDLQAELTAFVPVGKNCEINQLTLTNNSKETKDFSVFSYVEFCLWNQWTT